MNQALIIFIKNPELGKVKTRLAATVGDEKALLIYMELLKHTQQIACAVEANRLLFYSKFMDTNDNWDNQAFQKQLQQGSDLGERMQAAFEQALVQHEKAVIIGSDCAALTPAIIENAFQALDTHDFVVGPAEDGGYYLLGMKQVEPTLFQKMEWSTDQVLPETLKRMEAKQADYILLPMLSDIDYWEDWVKHGWAIPELEFVEALK